MIKIITIPLLSAFLSAFFFALINFSFLIFKYVKQGLEGNISFQYKPPAILLDEQVVGFPWGSYEAYGLIGFIFAILLVRGYIKEGIILN